jgi:hypothetical protein
MEPSPTAERVWLVQSFTQRIQAFSARGIIRKKDMVEYSWAEMKKPGEP